MVISLAGLGDCQGFEEKGKKRPNDKTLDLNRKDLW